MPKVSWATELAIDPTALQLERPHEWFQEQIKNLHAKRAQAFADYTRFRNSNQAFIAEIMAFELYCQLTKTVCDFTGDRLPLAILEREETRKTIVGVKGLRNICDRCGFVWTARHPRFVDGLCASCLALQEKVLRRGRMACQPWQGRFASDDVTPVNAQGAPILPGTRYCGKSDCVNPKHITKGKVRNVSSNRRGR